MFALLDPSLYDCCSSQNHDQGQMSCNETVGLQQDSDHQVGRHEAATGYAYDPADSRSMLTEPWSMYDTNMVDLNYNPVQPVTDQSSQLLIDPQLVAADPEAGEYTGQVSWLKDCNQSLMLGPPQPPQPFLGLIQHTNDISFDPSNYLDPTAVPEYEYPPTGHDSNQSFEAGGIYLENDTATMPYDSQAEPFVQEVAEDGFLDNRLTNTCPFVYTPQEVNDLISANSASATSLPMKTAMNADITDILPSSLSAKGKRFRVGDLVDIYLHSSPSRRKSAAGLELRKRKEKPYRQRDLPDSTRFKAFTSDISHQDFMLAMRYRMKQLDTLEMDSGTDYGDRVTAIMDEESLSTPLPSAVLREYDQDMEEVRAREISIKDDDWNELYMTRPFNPQWSRVRHMYGAPPPQVYTEDIDKIHDHPSTLSDTDTPSLHSANQGPSAGTRSRRLRSPKSNTSTRISREDDMVDRTVAFRYASRRKEEPPTRRRNWRNMRGHVLETERYKELKRYALANSVSSRKQLDPYSTVQGLRASRNEPPL